jgi:DNA/RNA-binding protein KIN17
MEFGKFLGREGICRVEEDDKGGLKVAWIDNSPDALRRQEANKKKERQDKNDEEREQRLIAEQVNRAQKEAEDKKEPHNVSETATMLQRDEGEKLTLNFGKNAPTAAAATTQMPTPPESSNTDSAKSQEPGAISPKIEASDDAVIGLSSTNAASEEKPPAKIGLNLGGVAKPKNVFAAASKKNALNGSKAPPNVVQQRPMSEAERIMKEELQRKRLREGNGFHGPPSKRARPG